MDYLFCVTAVGACGWGSKESAEAECSDLNKSGVRIDSVQVGECWLRDFRPEERAPGDFVIFCDGPFPTKWKRPHGRASVRTLPPYVPRPCPLIPSFPYSLPLPSLL